MPSKVDVAKVIAEVDIFKLEYPDYNCEVVSDYIKLLDDFNQAEIDLFIMKLGY